MRKKDDVEILYENIFDLAEEARHLYAEGEELWYTEAQEVIDRLLDIQHLANVCLRDARSIKRKREV